MQGQTEEEYKGVAAFFNFLSSSAIQAKWHQDTGYLPITMAAYDETKASGFYDENPGTDIAGHPDDRQGTDRQFQGIAPGLLRPDPRHHRRRAGRCMGRDKSAQEALDSAAARGNELLRRFEQANR
jgi:sn-glycerol 3-phosphate transport system substrate-binding protein